MRLHFSLRYGRYGIGVEPCKPRLARLFHTFHTFHTCFLRARMMYACAYKHARARTHVMCVYFQVWKVWKVWKM